MRIFRLPSVCAQPCVSAATTLQAKLPRRSRAGELLMSLVIAWLRASSPSQPFPDRAAPCAEWPPKSCPASAAPVSLRHGALWKARWRWLVLSNELHASPRGFLRSPRGQIHRPAWRRTSLRAYRGAHVRWFVLRHTGIKYPMIKRNRYELSILLQSGGIIIREGIVAGCEHTLDELRRVRSCTL